MMALNDVLHSLLAVVDLGFMEVPTMILLAVTLCLFGLGFRKSLLSYGGVSVIFAYYICLEMAALV